MTRRPPRSPLFPSPPLSRSRSRSDTRVRTRRRSSRGKHGCASRGHRTFHRRPAVRRCDTTARSGAIARGPGARVLRSEEHTSELQSPCNLVCRLLLEKKKYTATATVLARGSANTTQTLSFSEVATSNSLALRVLHKLKLHKSFDSLSAKSTVTHARQPPVTFERPDSTPHPIVRRRRPLRRQNRSETATCEARVPPRPGAGTCHPPEFPSPPLRLLFFLNNPAPPDFSPFPLRDPLPI